MDLPSDHIEDSAGSQKALSNASDDVHHKYKMLQDKHDALCLLHQLPDDIELHEFFKRVHRIITSFMPAAQCSVALFDATLETIAFPYHVNEQLTYASQSTAIEAFEGSLIHHVIKTKKTLCVNDAILADLIKEHGVTPVDLQGSDWLVIPLMNGDYVVGVIMTQSIDVAVTYSPEHVDFLHFIAQHMTANMLRIQDRSMLKSAVDARTHELMQQIRERKKSDLLQESLFKISELTSDITLDISEFYLQVHHIVGRLLNASNFYIARHSQESNLLTFVYYFNESADNIEQEFRPRVMAKRLTELVIRKGEMFLFNQADIERLYEQGDIDDYNRKVTTWLGVPLIHSGHTLGAMVVQNYQDNVVYTQQDAELLNFVSHHISSAIRRRELMAIERQTHDILEQQVKMRTLALEEEIVQRKQAEELLTHTASHDSLTGLANRVVFIDLLNHAIASSLRFPKRLFAILFLDLDRFKVVNDSLGHHAGDTLLKIVAKELVAIVRTKDTVARFGGDEFVILIEDLESQERAYEVAERITSFLSKPFIIEDHPVYIGTSIGILFNNERYKNADIMLRDADTAMYHAKEKGRGRYEVFDSSMHSKIQNALTLEADLRDAIKETEFTPYYQPIVELESGKLIGFEALARWESKKRGFVFPNDFIPLAEDRNLVIPIDLQILEKACVRLDIWHKQYGCTDLYISCNLYCEHFFNMSLADDISAILKRVGVSPKQLRIELTERALLDNSDVVLQNMKALKALGVKILLDDFGTGYSSLSYLHLFPIDVLKIDRSFITNVHDHESHQAIIKTIIDLAGNLDMATVGEGIEGVADAEILKNMGCRYGQGYYFSKPLRAVDAEEVLFQTFLEK